jgi:hypothetical protein
MMKIMFKRLTAVAMLLLLPFAAQADIAGDIEAGVSAEEVVANALAEGMSIGDVMSEVAQVVGSQNVGMFASAAARAYARQTGSDVSSPDVMTAVNNAVGAAAGAGFPGTSAGAAYASNSANFVPSTLAGGAGGAGGSPGGRPGAGAGGGSGGGGGQVVEDALCEAAGSEPGCLDAA